MVAAEAQLNLSNGVTGLWLRGSLQRFVLLFFFGRQVGFICKIPLKILVHRRVGSYVLHELGNFKFTFVLSL